MTKNNPRRIRVLVVDDHTMVRQGLATFLKVYDDLQLVGEAADGESAIKICTEVLPDVILMDMALPGMDGPTTTRTIREKFPKTHVLALTSFKEGPLIQRALEAACNRVFAQRFISRGTCASNPGRACWTLHSFSRGRPIIGQECRPTACAWIRPY